MGKKNEQSGKLHFVKANQTGVDFYKPEDNPDESVDSDQRLLMMRESDKIGLGREKMEMEGTLDVDEIERMQFERPIDKSKDVLIDLERTHCRYVRFNGRSMDEDILFNDHVSVMLPS